MDRVAIFLVVHGLLGGFDVILNHEILVRLPSRVSALEEQRLHSIREAIFGTLFLALAWLEWHGLFVWIIAGLLLGETLVTTRDTVIEVPTRVLPVTERVAHVLLLINLGIVIALVAMRLKTWASLPTGVKFTEYGWLSWALTILATGAFGWSIRDALSAVRLSTIARSPPCADKIPGTH